MSFIFGGGSDVTTVAERISAFQSTTCEFGTPVPLLYGLCRTSPNLINYQDFTTQEKRTEVSTGKNSSSTTIDYLYYTYVELALCEGPIDGLGKIWIGDDEFSGFDAFNKNDQEGAPLYFSNSSPTNYMKQHHKDIAVEYPNLSFLYGKVYLGTNSANLPNYSFEVKGICRSDYSNGVDCNPAVVIKDLLTRIGLGNKIDTESWKKYAEYCQAADLLISTPTDYWSDQKTCQEVVEELLELTNTYAYWLVDSIHFFPRDYRKHGNWSPNTDIVYDLDHDDLSKYNDGVITVKRKTPSEQYNYITVSYEDRSNQYEEESIAYQNTTDIEKNGIRKLDIDGTWFKTKSRAVAVAEMRALMAAMEKNEYTFQLGQKYCRITPGDLLRLTDSTIGISNQVVMVSEVSTDENGLMTITAIQYDNSITSAAEFEVTEEYRVVDLNITPSNTKPPLFITPPADMVTSPTGVEIWLGLQGADDTWGGCDVYASNEDGNYSYYARHSGNSNMGTTTTDLSADGTEVNIHFTNPREFTLLTGDDLTKAADRGNTRLWLNGEIMSFTAASFVSTNTYKISGLRRAEKNTTAISHPASSQFCLIDTNIQAIRLTKDAIGQNIYVKLPSFNALIKNRQSLEDVSYYSTTVQAYDLPNVANLTATTRYADSYGAGYYPRYDILVNWTPPDCGTYQCAQVFYKCSDTAVIYAADGSTIVQADEAGFTADWQAAGQAYNSITIPQATVGSQYKIAVCVQDIYGFCESPDSSTQTTVLIATKTTVPNMPSNAIMTFAEFPTVTWDFVTNADVKYYEIWSGPNHSGNLLARTNGNSAALETITEREGTVYLSAVSVYDKRSTEASIYWNKVAPSQPNKPTWYSGVTGLQISMQAAPSDALGIHLYIDDEQYTTGTAYSHVCKSGNYIIYYCWYDCFGDGTESMHVTATVDTKIPQEYIDNMTITAEQLDSALSTSLEQINNQQSINDTIQAAVNTNANDIISIKGDLTTKGTQIAANDSDITALATRVTDNESSIAQIQVNADSVTSRMSKAENGIATNTSQITQTANSISTVVSNLENNNVSGYSAFTQLDNAIQLCVKDTDLNGDEIASRINLGGGTVAIDGKYVKISGETEFSDDVQIKGTMVAGSIDCDKGVSISGGALTITKEGLTLDCKNSEDENANTQLVFNEAGMTFVDSNGKSFAQIGRFAAGPAEDGQYITLGWDVAPRTVLCFPLRQKTMISGYGDSAMYTVCQATQITKDGFKANVYSALAAGTQSKAYFTQIWSLIHVLDWSSDDPAPARRTDYSEWSVLTGVLPGETQVDLSTSLDFYFENAYGHYGSDWADTWSDISFELYVGGTCKESTLVKTYNGNLAPGHITLNLTRTINFESGQEVKYRWKVLHRDWDGNFSSGIRLSSPQTYCYAKVLTETPIENSSGTCNWIALG